jgi:feruloyl-CoA synthase
VAGPGGPGDIDGTVVLRSAEPLGGYPVSVVHSLRAWASVDPGHPVVAERGQSGAWRTCSYGEAAAAGEAIGQALLDRGLGPDRPLLVLSGSSVNHLLLTLGAMTAGVPVAPVSVAYSLQSRDHERIRAITELIRPGAVFADDADRFAAALDALTSAPAIVATGHRAGADRLEDLLATVPGRAVREAFGALGPDTVAKILFTSGSTGAPKGVLNTHRMLSANQQMMRQVWPFLVTERPVIVDWLPWSHTFGGNHNMNMMLTSGGTIHVDAGRPAPALFAQTIENLTDVPPTVYFNVPAGYALLVPALEGDRAFAERFFSRLRLMFNAAAALPATLRSRLTDIARRTTGLAVPVTGSWGATETGPAVTTAHYDYADARCIGVPLPGAEVKLVPAEDGYEIRARGPMVTPGYYGRADLTAQAFDDDGFYLAGDAVAFAGRGDPNAGLLFRGRTAEARKFLGEEPQPDGDLIVHPALDDLLARALAEHNDAAGSSARIERLLVMAQPADLDAGEITDKGYVNQRRVLARRAALAEMLYTNPVPAGVTVAGRMA